MTSLATEEHKISDIKLRNQANTNDTNDKVFNAVGFYLYEDKKLQKVSLSLTSKALVLKSDDNIVKAISMGDILGATYKQTDLQSKNANLQAKKIKLTEDQVALSKEVYVLKLHLLPRPPSKDVNAAKGERKRPEPRKYEVILQIISDNKTYFY